MALNAQMDALAFGKSLAVLNENNQSDQFISNKMLNNKFSLEIM